MTMCVENLPAGKLTVFREASKISSCHGVGLGGRQGGRQGQQCGVGVKMKGRRLGVGSRDNDYV